MAPRLNRLNRHRSDHLQRKKDLSE